MSRFYPWFSGKTGLYCDKTGLLYDKTSQNMEETQAFDEIMTVNSNATR